MKKRILLLVCTLMLVVPVARPQTPDTPRWTLYSVKGERIAIALPVLPVLETSKEARARPQKDRQRRIVKCSAKGVVYTIHIVENPKPRVSLETFIQEQTKANSGSLTSERDLTVDGFAAKEFAYADGQGLVQFVATDDRLYEVSAQGAPAGDPRINTFFHYFSLKKKDGAIQVSESVQAGALEAGAGIYLGKDVDTKVRLIKKPEPVYSERARGEQVTGTVILKCVFAADGTVSNIRVVSGLPFGLTEKAIEAARKIRFVPATKDGKNVSMWMQLEYNFNLY